MVLMMGLFSAFCGLIYNEFFAIPLIVQKSCYEKINGHFVRSSHDCVYNLGMDHVWAQAENETAFVNSFKMKFAIIVGVIQMLFGIMLKGMNAVHFGLPLDLFFETLPQFVFMVLSFGYMSLLIIAKWLTNFDAVEKPVSIISLFINFNTVDDPLIG